MSEQMTAEQARQVLEQEQRIQMDQCQKEIEPLLQQVNAICAKYGCRYGAQVFITGDGRIGVNLVLSYAN